MEMNRGMVLRFNPGHHHVFTDGAGLVNQRLHQRAANPFALMGRVDVDRVLNRMTEAVKGAPVAERGVAGDYAVFLAHQNRVARKRARLKPGDSVIGIDGFIVPDRGSVQHRVVVNLAYRSAVFFAGMTNDHDEASVCCSL